MTQMMPKTCPRWCPIHAPDMPQMIPQTCPRWCPRVVPTMYRWHWIQWFKQTCLGSAENNQSHRNLFWIRKVYLSHILHCTFNLCTTEHTWSHTLSVIKCIVRTLYSFISTTHAMNSQAVIWFRYMTWPSAHHETLNGFWPPVIWSPGTVNDTWPRVMNAMITIWPLVIGSPQNC